MLVWLNGTVMTAAEARIAPGDRGFTLGDGVFETIRVQGGRPRHLGRHLARLREGAAILGLPIAAGLPERAVEEMLAAPVPADCVLRLTVSRGEGARGLVPPERPSPTMLLSAAPLAPMPAETHLVIATVTRRNEHSPLARIKSLNMLDNVLARAEAAGRGAGEALLLNTAGRVAEAATATLFALIGGRVVTPPVEEGALPGIARAVAVEAMGEGAVIQRPVEVAELFGAAEIVLTNSLGVRPVVTMDGRVIGAGRPGSLAAGLREHLGA